MKTIAHIHRNATTTWDDIADSETRLLKDSGDIILNLRDAWDPAPFHRDEVLERWADGWGFSLAGISIPDAVDKMHRAFIFPTIRELVPAYAEAVELVRGADITEHEELREMLDFPVRVNGALVRLFLCDVYDGPFPSDQEKLGSLLLRSAG